MDKEDQPPHTGMSWQERYEYLKNFEFEFCASISKYEKIGKIGQGTFGEVFKGRDKSNPKRIVALKKILMENERDGFPVTAVREIRILQKLNHLNIVHLDEICHGDPNPKNCLSSIYLVFEFCEYDLAALLSNRSVRFSLGEIKKILQQIFNGLYFMHANAIIHRDMKTANILINKNGTLKLADFGLSRAFSKKPPNIEANTFTTGVVTLWYRPPEILLGDQHYGTKVDIWSAGCVMAELWTRSALLPGRTEQSQLGHIAKLCGSMTPEVWPNIVNLDLFHHVILPVGYRRRVVDRLKPFLRDSNALDLLDKLLVLDPLKRIDADTALNHDFFWSDPMPCSLMDVLSKLPPNLHDYQTTQRHFHQRHHRHRHAHYRAAEDCEFQDRIF